MTYQPAAFEEVTPVGADQIETRYPYSLGTISNCPECNTVFPGARALDEDMDFIVLNHATHRIAARHKAAIEAELRRHGERV